MLILSIMTLSLSFLFSGCNAKEEDEENTYVASPSVAVNGFTLDAKPSVLAHLDSVFFTIDLKNGVIFNADSLPMGTDVSAISAKITIPSSVTSAEIEMTGGINRTGSFDYKANSADTIDFTGRVVLTLSADDGLSKKYRLKVNVHKTNPDSLQWDAHAFASLPSRMKNPKTQKTVSLDGKTYSFIEEADGSRTLAVTSSVRSAEWTKSSLALPFAPASWNDATIGTSHGSIFMVDANSHLWQSPDGLSWTDTGVRFSLIIGDFNNSLLGIYTDASGSAFHTRFPADAAHPDSALESNFPLRGFSNFGVYTSRWSQEPTGFLAGGVDAEGKTLPYSWGFDGNQWTIISSANTLPEIKNVRIVPYFIYRKTTSAWLQTEYSIWMAIGGTLADGSSNKTVYMTYDNGVNWGKAPQGLQLPESLPSLTLADFILDSSPKTADLSDAWTKARRLPYSVDGNIVGWDCPYIYTFGGLDADGNLNGEILRAVLARLTFAPLF